MYLVKQGNHQLKSQHYLAAIQVNYQVHQLRLEISKHQVSLAVYLVLQQQLEPNHLYLGHYLLHSLCLDNQNLMSRNPLPYLGSLFKWKQSLWVYSGNHNNPNQINKITHSVNLYNNFSSLLYSDNNNHNNRAVMHLEILSTLPIQVVLITLNWIVIHLLLFNKTKCRQIQPLCLVNNNNNQNYSGNPLMRIRLPSLPNHLPLCLVVNHWQQLKTTHLPLIFPNSHNHLAKVCLVAKLKGLNFRQQICSGHPHDQKTMKRMVYFQWEVHLKMPQVKRRSDSTH